MMRYVIKQQMVSDGCFRWRFGLRGLRVSVSRESVALTMVIDQGQKSPDTGGAGMKVMPYCPIDKRLQKRGYKELRRSGIRLINCRFFFFNANITSITMMVCGCYKQDGT